MCRTLIKRLLPIVVLTILAVEVAISQNRPEAERQNPAPDSLVLSPDEKAELLEALRLKTALGDELWPGLARADIPIILFNERYEFLVGVVSPPAPWVAVEGDSFGGKHYCRRNSSNPQAFATQVGDRWAGSMSTLEMMNRKAPMKFGREYHLMAIHHEMFHAYEAIQAPERFKQAQKVYAVEKRYPFKETEFETAWDKEGSLLAAALKATDGATVRSTVREFLQTRDARRTRAGLSSDLLAYERELEWLEGLAKYIEIRLYELAALRSSDPAYSAYRPAVPYRHEVEFYRLGKQLGRQQGDLRFYSSGMAQARLLDTLSPGWKEKVMHTGVFLEDLLRAAVEPREGG